ncbi:MAG: excinuclease ABC subunit UvrA [Patescibacteria group bacterium]|nr:excinuclease ABC subunit UvrA [Patescibacteria group bacterium]
MSKYIEIKGARENNLKNIDLKIPRNRVVCFVGVSGSGKSTIAFDIVAKEGQRQYFESLSAYARRYLEKSNRPQVESTSGISSTVVISQERVRSNPRSTVGTLTEAYNYLRLLYSRVGWPPMDSSYYSFNHPYGACKKCKGLGKAMEIDIKKLVDFDKSLNEGAILYSNWRVGSMWWKIIKATKFFDMDKKVKDYSKEELDLLLYAQKQVIVDKSGLNNVINWTFKGVVTHLLARGSSTHRLVNKEEMKYFQFIPCPECQGWRLNKESLAVRLNGLNIGEVANLPISECLNFVEGINHPNASVIKPRLIAQLKNLVNVGVGYLSLNRSADTLSGGEAQRIKMARQMGCDLVETIYVLDEPTAGLHPRDVDKVVENLRRLKANSNTVLVVEHDETVIKNADFLIEVGPGGGKKGGEIVAQGTFAEVMANPNSITAKYLKNEPKMISKTLRQASGNIKIMKAKLHNLKNFDVMIPTGVLVALTGVSGSGKSSLVEEILTQRNEKVILMDQKPVGDNVRGCLATYIGAFDKIRKIFSQESGASASLFSFNGQGACLDCQGLGFINMDMNFLGDVKIKCETCQGKRYRKEALGYQYQGKSIDEVLAMTALEAKDFFADEEIKEKLDLLISVGLDYLELGQTLDTLSGGESQRLKLASRLSNKGDFYILDEPTSGLHFADIEKLMKLLNLLVDNGNTVLVIEHNLTVISQADWIIDLGPEGGEKGGYLVAEGTPKQVAQVEKSYTGQYLKKFLELS